MMKVFMNLTMLDYPFCLRPLKPPVYECKDGHVGCADCRGEQQCQECDGGGTSFNVRSTTVDTVLTSVTVECCHEGFGLYVTYYKLDDHQSACSFMPCKCSMPGYGYEDPPLALTHHLSNVHLMTLHRIQYGKVLHLQVLASEPRHLLFMKENGRVFFLVGSALSMDVPIAMSVICIRGGASPPPHYVAKVWVNGPPGAPNGRTDAVELEIEVTSSKEPGAITMEELTSLTLPPKLLAGAGSSRTVSLHIRIDKLTS